MIHINWRGFLGLPSKYIGVVYNEETKEVCKVINPSYDFELYDPCWTKNNPKERLLKLKRNNIPVTMSISDCAILIDKVEKMLNDPSISNNS